MQRFFSLLRQDDDIQAIKYFTALVEGQRRGRQEAYLLALDSLQKIEIIRGKFKTKAVTCHVPECRHKKSRIFNVPEEKRTDVNIALHMLDDAYNDLCDRMVLVSGDSDLVPALNMVRRVRPNVEIIVYVPASDPRRGAAVELRSAADKNRTLPVALLSKAQFPHKVVLSGTQSVEKPLTW